eukprot:6106149-Amphidinium_carterae.1
MNRALMVEVLDESLAKRLKELEQVAHEATSMDAVLAKRLKAFERVVLKALLEESLGRLLSSGGITVKAALEDFGEEGVMTCVKELCWTRGPQGTRAKE